MEQIQTNTVMVVAMVYQHIQVWLRKVLFWLIDAEGERTVKTIGESICASFSLHTAYRFLEIGQN